MWRAWNLDGPTVQWTIILLWAIALESWAVVTNQPVHTLTHHLRPAMVAHPLLWFLTAGFAGWLVFHFLIQPFRGWWWP